MLSGNKLRMALAAAPTIALDGYFYRSVEEASLHKFDPPQPLYALGPGLSGQRFTPPGGPPALYVAEQQYTALVESTHLITSSLREAGLVAHSPSMQSM